MMRREAWRIRLVRGVEVLVVRAGAGAVVVELVFAKDGMSEGLVDDGEDSLGWLPWS
jgi:hypothetical protein